MPKLCVCAALSLSLASVASGYHWDCRFYHSQDTPALYGYAFDYALRVSPFTTQSRSSRGRGRVREYIVPCYVSVCSLFTVHLLRDERRDEKLGDRPAQRRLQQEGFLGKEVNDDLRLRAELRSGEERGQDAPGKF